MLPATVLLLGAALTGCGSYEIEPGADAGEVTGQGPGTVVVDFIDGTTLAEARQRTGLDLRWATERSADEALAVAEVDDLAAALARLDATPGVEAAEPSLEFQALDADSSGLLPGRLLPSLRYPDDPMYDRQWNLHAVGAPAGWRVGAGQGVTVAVIDTGVSRVADLAGTTVLDGVSFVTGVPTADDDNGHGTHVAGTIAQTTHNGLGVAGVAPRAKILPLKALAGQGFGRSEWIASAIDEAADQGADVINMSLGGPRSEIIQLAVEKAAARGVIIVAAAGNTGREGVSWPARSPGAIGVAATGPTDERAPYSTFGEGVDISAPGGDKRHAGGGILQDTVDSSTAGHSFKELQGTSMATPHVAGAAAVLLSAGAGTPAEVRAALTGSATDLGEPGWDASFGHGRLDIAAAVRHLLLRQRAPLFLLGGLLSLGLASFGGMRRRGLVALTGALTAGGLFLLPMLPLPPSAWVDLLGRPLLHWPGAVLSPAWGGNPLWLSALLPALLTFVLGTTRTLGWLAAGVTGGVGAHLLHGALTGSLDPSWLPGLAGSAWLGANGLFCLIMVVAVAGVDRLRRKEEGRP